VLTHRDHGPAAMGEQSPDALVITGPSSACPAADADMHWVRAGLHCGALSVDA